MKIKVYTDGACSGNPGIGGWGAIILVDDKKPIYLKGGSQDTTNNKMELTAAIESLKFFSISSKIQIFTDSKYVKNGIETWINNWKKNGWKTSSKKIVKNKDLWLELDKQIAFPPVIFFSILTIIAFYTVNYNSKVDENQLVILSHIKSDKNDKFDKILFDEVMVAAAEYQDDDPNKQKLNDKAMRSFEILKPASMNQDSTWTYIFIADPYVEGALYNIMPSLKQKYGEEGAEEVFGRWSECFTDDGQDAYFTKRAEM